MTTTQIILLILGIILVILSFFVIDREEPKKTTFDSISLNKEQWGEDIQKIRFQMKQQLEEEMNRYISETEEVLSKISNEKIMSVQEFSDQLLAKIEHNNEEVVFLYNMLKGKEEEFKNLCNKLESVKREHIELIEQLEEMNSELRLRKETKEKDSYKYKEEKVKVQNKHPKKFVEDTEDRSGNILLSIDSTYMDASLKEEKRVKENQTHKELSLEEEILRKKNDEILKLHFQNKSVAEISKILSLGQGEVKLIIDLYGQK